jgi:hypothetical protein
MTWEDKLLSMSKQELGEFLNELQHKIDSGRCQGKDRQLRDTALKIYLEKFDAPH